MAYLNSWISYHYQDVLSDWLEVPEAFIGVLGEHASSSVASFFLVGQTNFTRLFIGWVFPRVNSMKNFFFLCAKGMYWIKKKNVIGCVNSIMYR